MINEHEKTDIEAILADPAHFKNLPTERKTELVCYEAVFADPHNVRFVPESAFTYEITGIPLLKKPELISSIPESAINKILPYILADTPDLFALFPEESLTLSICMAGVKRSGNNLEFVPEGMRTEDICREALKSCSDLQSGDAKILSHVPHPNVCIEAMREHSNHIDCTDMLKYLRKEVINDEIAEFSVSQNGRSLHLVPLHLQNNNLACQAAKSTGNIAIFGSNIREDVKTEKAYICGLDKNSVLSFLFVPKNKRTPGLCLRASKMFPEYIAERPEEIPDNVKTGCNVFSLNAKMERCTGHKFDVSQIEDFYNGIPLKVNSILTSKGTLKNQEVRFDKNKQELSFSPAKQEIKKGFKI
jgi:hypothetical protein